MIHAGELIVPGAPSRSAAVNAIATGQTIQAVQSDGLYRGPGGYVLNRGDVSQLVGNAPVSLMGSPPTPGSTIINNSQGGGINLQELTQQTGLLGELVSLAKRDQSSRVAAARLARHQRYRK